ncbi:MAG: cation-transporting P-type ATPase [Oscillospiraceae bacterium]|nr:cation-transporting P-type ATPase [Oscillospiraceae bacterium]
MIFQKEVVILNENLRSIPWETLSDAAALDKLDSDRNIGLADVEAANRLDIFGENKLPEKKRDSFVKRFLGQFNNALIYVLLGAAVLTGVMRHWVDTWVILAVVVINAIIGHIQEDKAQKALDSIRNLLSLKAAVIRSGARREVAAEALVPGDIVILKAGDKIPADIRLISVSRFEVDESALTGESLAVTKSIVAVEAGTVLGERECMAYAGTNVRTGDAVGIVVATGGDTEIGKINQMLHETESTTTPLMKKMNSLAKALSIVVLVLSVILFGYDIIFRGVEYWSYTVLAVIGLAVAAIPEGLPAVLTITLAIGVQRMAGKNAIIRRLPSVETLGAVTVICSDKTGTLTKNEMTVTNIYTASGDFDVSGLGYAPSGEITMDNGQWTMDNGGENFAERNSNLILERLIQCAYLCNEADVYQEGEIWLPQGAPTEAALKVLGRKAGYSDVGANKLSDIPFDSEHKYRAALYEIDGKRILFVNGATERIMNLCVQQTNADGAEPLDSSFWESKIEQAASRGQRLLGFAYAEAADDKVDIKHEDLQNMVFAGVVGIIDPPRAEAIESIRVCREAGIRVKMITGDHALTAREIGRQMGLTDHPKVISGAELETMDDAQIRVAAMECDIFARTSPEHKLRLVKALQELGEVVAMTGDGVNDAPALKRADIGVAMGIKGTSVTQDSAEMVLADDNFSSIVSAVEEGRTIYDNIRKTLLFLLPTNGAQALVIITAIIFNFAELPITPVQILWVNMVVAVTLALTMAFEPTEQNVMKRAPRNPKEPLLGGVFLFRIGFASVVVTALTLAIFFYSNGRHGAYNLAYTRTMAVNMLVFGQLFYLFNCRKLNSTIFRGGFFGNKFAFVFAGILVAIQLGFTYLPFMQAWFDTVSLPLSDWIYFAAGGVAVLLLVELEKAITSRIFGKN